MRRTSSGVTLIALIITIIVLLILAGVTIAMIMGDNGILNQAINAREQTQQAKEKEESILAQYEELLNNGVNISGDDEEVTDDIWKISKDITGKTSKVNIYLESIYYKPTFKEFFAREFVLIMLKNSYGMPFYDATDGVDFYLDYVYLQSSDQDREEFDSMDNTYYRMYEKYIIYEFSLMSDISDELSEEEQKNEIKDLLQTHEEEFSEMGIDVMLKYEEILQEYNQKYGSILEMPEEMKNTEYTIIYPDGSSENLIGEELITNRVRVPVNENGEYNFVITAMDDYEKGYNVTINNIGDYMVEIGDYIYTYNCVPALPIESYGEWQQTISDANIDMNITDYRLDFNGWNVYAKDNTKTEYEEILEEVNGEKVTAMYGTYAGCGNLTGFTEEKMAEYQANESNDIVDMYKNININIPDTITIMFYTFSNTDLFIGPIIPENVEIVSEIYSGCDNLDVITYEHMSGKKNYVWVTSDTSVKNNLQAIFLLEDSAVTFSETNLNNKIKRYSYDVNGDFYTDEDLPLIFEPR